MSPVGLGLIEGLYKILYLLDDVCRCKTFCGSSCSTCRRTFILRKPAEGLLKKVFNI